MALQVAWGGSAGESTDTSGALQKLADEPFSSVLLWVVAVGLVGLALWQLSEAIWGHRRGDRTRRIRKRVASAAKAVVYAGLGVTGALVALSSGSSGSGSSGSGSSGSGSEQQTTSGVLALPGGQAIVVVAGLVIIGVGAASLVKGVRQSFDEDIDLSPASPKARRWITRLGSVGYVAKGIALGVVGALLGYAALSFDPQQAQGLDGALRTILRQPFGQYLLTAVALGFVAFGIFAMFQARYRRM